MEGLLLPTDTMPGEQRRSPAAAAYGRRLPVTKMSMRLANVLAQTARKEKGIAYASECKRSDRVRRAQTHLAATAWQWRCCGSDKAPSVFSAFHSGSFIRCSRQRRPLLIELPFSKSPDKFYTREGVRLSHRQTASQIPH